MARNFKHKGQRGYSGILSIRRAAMYTLALTAAAALMGNTSCGNNKGPSNNMNAQSYGHDGYMGLSNSNPSLPNRNGQQLNYGSDARFAERKLKEMGGVSKINMTFQANNLYVTLTPAPGVGEAELRQKAISTLRYNMPRYIVHVKITKT